MFAWFLSRLRHPQIGNLILVENQERYRTAAAVYYAARLVSSDNAEEVELFLFTDHELQQAHERALRNLEDLPEAWIEEETE